MFKKSGKSIIAGTVDRCPQKVDTLNLAQGDTEFIKFHEIWYISFRATLVIKGLSYTDRQKFSKNCQIVFRTS